MWGFPELCRQCQFSCSFGWFFPNIDSDQITPVCTDSVCICMCLQHIYVLGVHSRHHLHCPLHHTSRKMRQTLSNRALNRIVGVWVSLGILLVIPITVFGSGSSYDGPLPHAYRHNSSETRPPNSGCLFHMFIYTRESHPLLHPPTSFHLLLSAAQSCRDELGEKGVKDKKCVCVCVCVCVCEPVCVWEVATTTTVVKLKEKTWM